jgi:phosphoglycolate phosphatase-like HAD superfamily hydrolase
MTERPLVLFDVDGVLVGKDELRRLPGAAEALAQLRHDGDAVLSLVTDADEDIARHRTTEVGVERYLDFTVGAYGSGPAADARDKAERAYHTTFRTIVVRADSADDVRRTRSAADVLVAVAATEPAADELRAAGADHVIASLIDLVPLVRAAREDNLIPAAQRGDR